MRKWLIQDLSDWPTGKDFGQGGTLENIVLVVVVVVVVTVIVGIMVIKITCTIDNAIGLFTPLRLGGMRIKHETKGCRRPLKDGCHVAIRTLPIHALPGNVVNARLLGGDIVIAAGIVGHDFTPNSKISRNTVGCGR